MNKEVEVLYTLHAHNTPIEHTAYRDGRYLMPGMACSRAMQELLPSKALKEITIPTALRLAHHNNLRVQLRFS